MVGIYKITNPNGRIYIGQSINIERRWESYKKLNCKDQPSLFSSLKKYGFENHKFELIEECLIEELDNKEIEWGIFYDVLSNKHLNNRLGRGRGIVSEETKKLMSKNSKGISRGKGMKFTEQHKNNISLAKTGSKYLNFKIRKDKGVSKTHHIEAVKKSKMKPIFQYDLEGNFIKEWKSGKEASIALNINQPNINLVCNGKTKTYKGFIWRFKI